MPGVKKESILLRNGMTVELLDSVYIYQGDMLLTKEQIDEFNKPVARGAITSIEKFRWPNHTVYYTFAPDFEFVKEAHEAMADYHQSSTNIIFLPATDAQANKVRFFHNEGGGAYSYVGMVGGTQDISIGREFLFQAKGTIMHELGHAVGLIHEQSKADRDNYININLSNIIPGKENNYQITPNQTHISGFDFESIMLYGSYSDFAINKAIPILTRKDGSTWESQRDFLSMTDQAIIRSKYPTVDGYVRRFQVPSHENNGMGITMADINRNGTPDMVVNYTNVYNKTSSTMGRDLFFMIFYDVDIYGNPTSVSGPYWVATISNDSNQNFGASVSATDFNNNGYQDLIFMYGQGARSTSKVLTYRIAFDVDKNYPGSFSLSGEMSFYGMGHNYNGIGLNVYDFNNNNKPDLIMSVYDDPDGNNYFKYRIAYDLDVNGSVKGGVSDIFTFGGIGNSGQGSGVTVGDIDKNGKPDLLFMCVDNPSGANNIRYAILWNVNSSGQYTGIQYNYITQPFINIGSEHQGADCVFSDIDKNGTLDCLFMSLANPDKANEIQYITGMNITASGAFTSWKKTRPNPVSLFR